MSMLFGGATVALCETVAPGFVSPRPTFVQHRGGGPAARAEQLIGKGVNSWRYRCSGVPFGRRRVEMERFLRQHRVGAILAEFGHIGCNLAPVGQALGLPVFVYFRGFDASKRLRVPRIVRRYRAAMPRVTGIVAVSQSLLDNLAAHGIAHRCARVIPTGVDTDRFAPGVKDPRLILAVGRIIAKKAPTITLDAFAAVAEAFPGHRLEIIGDGHLRASAERHARDLGLGDRVVFHGERGHEFVRDRLARAAVFLQHSLTDAQGNAEGLPTAIQEAMASGAVVISTRHAGIPEAISSGANGLLVDEGDGAGFAAALRAVLADPALADRLAAAARATALERLDIGRLHAELDALIRDGIERPARGR